MDIQKVEKLKKMIDIVQNYSLTPKDKLEKLIELIKEDTLTTKQSEQFLSTLLQIVKKTKDEFSLMSNEQKNEFKKAIDFLTEEYTKIRRSVSQETLQAGVKVSSEFAIKIDEIKSLVEEVMLSKPKDGINGKDGKDGSPDTGNEIVAKINKLPLTKDSQIDFTHIKNVPEFGIGRGVGSQARNLWQLQDVNVSGVTDKQVLTYDGVTNTWVAGSVAGLIQWGSITGTLSNQTDLQTALNLKLDITTAASTYVPYTGATTDVDLGTHELLANTININGLTGSNQGFRSADNSAMYLLAGLNTIADTTGQVVHIKSGDGNGNGNGADVEILGGDGGGGGDNNGGNIFLTGGLQSNAGLMGVIKIRTHGSPGVANLDTSSLSTVDRDFSFPDASGTLALTSDLSPYWKTDGSSGTSTGAWTLGAYNLTVDTDTLFVDATNHRIGIRTTSPLKQLQIGTSTTAVTTLIGGSSGAGGMYISYNNSGFTGGLVLESTAGSASNQGAGYVMLSNDGAALASGDRMGFNVFGGSISSTLVNNSAGLTAFADGAWSGSSAPARIVFEVAPSGSLTRAEAMRISNGGNVLISYTSTNTSIFNDTGRLQLKNLSSTTNNYTSIDSLDAAGTVASGIAFRVLDQTNHYGEINFGVRGSAGFNSVVLNLNSTTATFTSNIVSTSSTLSEIVRTNGNTNTPSTGLRLRNQTSGDMVDGFGGYLTFSIQDNAAVNNEIVVMQGLRNGADNTGKWILQIATAGVFGNKLTIDNAGAAVFAGAVSGITTLTATSNTTLAGYLRVGSNTAPSNTTAGDITGLRLALTNAAFSTDTFYQASGTSASTAAGTYYGATNTLTTNPASSSAGTLAATFASMQITGSQNNTTRIMGMNSEVRLLGSGTYNEITGIKHQGLVIPAAAVNFGTITDAIGIVSQAVNSFSNTVTGTITNLRGIQIINASNTTQTFTNQVGLNIAAISGATNNTALLIGTTTIPAGAWAEYNASANANYMLGNLEFGHISDTTLSRVSAGIVAIEGRNIAMYGNTTETTNTATVVAIAGTNHTHTITALASANTFGVPTIAVGSLTDSYELIIRVKDNGTARALAFNAIFRASSDLALPTTTTLSKTLYMKFKYNVADTKWDLLAKLDNFT